MAEWGNGWFLVSLHGAAGAIDKEQTVLSGLPNKTGAIPFSAHSRYDCIIINLAERYNEFTE